MVSRIGLANRRDPLTRLAAADENASSSHPLPQGGEGGPQNSPWSSITRDPALETLCHSWFRTLCHAVFAFPGCLESGLLSVTSQLWQGPKGNSFPLFSITSQLWAMAPYTDQKSRSNYDTLSCCEPPPQTAPSVQCSLKCRPCQAQISPPIADFHVVHSARSVPARKTICVRGDFDPYGDAPASRCTGSQSTVSSSSVDRRKWKLRPSVNTNEI